ncbi:MAG: type IV pilus assembly protein PilM [Armatimonadia bacterium]
MARGATHVLGLDIGSQAIKAVELRLAGHEIRMVGRPVVVPTPEHSVSGGRIVDSAAVSEALTDLLSRNGGFGVKKVVASVGGDTDVVVRIIEVPKMTGKELEEAIQWELERQAPFPVDQAVYDYRPIERDDTPPDAQNMEVLLAVAQEEMVDAHVESMMAAKLMPLAIDVEPLAIARAMADAGGEALADQTIVVVHIGASNTAIVIIRKGLLAFVRSIPTAGATFTSAIRQNVAEDEASAESVKRLFADLTGAYAFEGGGADTGYGEDTSSFDAIGGVDEEDSVFEVSDSSATDLGGGMALDEAATQLEVETGSEAYQLPPDQTVAAPPVGGAPAPAAKEPVPPEVEAVQAQVYEAIAQPLLDLSTEVRRSLDFYRRNHRNEDIDRMYISGGSAVIPGIADFIGGEVGLTCEIANPFEYVEHDDEEVPQEYLRDVAPGCVIAVGLAMRDMFG